MYIHYILTVKSQCRIMVNVWGYLDSNDTAKDTFNS
jgi:hypothetical protein